MLPYMNDKSIMRPNPVTGWGGLNHNRSAKDWEIYDMQNMSSREYPLLSPRKKRMYLNVATITSPMGSGPKNYEGINVPFWAANGKFYYDGVERGSVTTHAGHKKFAVLGKMILIFPDRAYYDITAARFGYLYSKQEVTGLQFQNGTYAGETAEANTLYRAGMQWEFSVGDAVKISGCTIHPENNGTFIIREVDGYSLRFYENSFTLDSTIRYTATADGLGAGAYYFYVGGTAYSFTLGSDLSEGDTLTWNGSGLTAVIGGTTSTIAVSAGSTGTPLVFADIPTNYTETNKVTLEREVPALEYVCVNDNRVWGAIGSTIYASKLNDPFNWSVFDGLSTDAWSAETSEGGNFTACISFQGYPTFFKERMIYKIQGDRPSNYAWTESERVGVQTYCDDSLAVVDGTLYYLSREGVCAYTGGDPRVISAPLGVNRSYPQSNSSLAPGGTDGVRYYLSIKKEGYASPPSTLYAYDTRYGVWHKEDDGNVDSFFNLGGNLYMLSAGGKIWEMREHWTDAFWVLSPPYPNPGYWENDEAPVDWLVEFADTTRFYETKDTKSQDKKGPLRLQIRCELITSSSLQVYVQYDSSGEWEQLANITGENKKKRTYIVPMILRRCDHYRLKLTGRYWGIGTGDTSGCVIYSITPTTYAGSAFPASTIPAIEEA